MHSIFLIFTLPNPSDLTAVRQPWYAKVTYKQSPGWQLPQQGHSGTTHTSPERQSWLPKLSPPWAVHSSVFRKPKRGVSSMALIILLNQLFKLFKCIVIGGRCQRLVHCFTSIKGFVGMNWQELWKQHCFTFWKQRPSSPAKLPMSHMPDCLRHNAFMSCLQRGSPQDVIPNPLHTQYTSHLHKKSKV